VIHIGSTIYQILETVPNNQKIWETFTRIFAGFTSLCTIPRLCRYCKALAGKRKLKELKGEHLSHIYFLFILDKTVNHFIYLISKFTYIIEVGKVNGYKIEGKESILIFGKLDNLHLK